MSEEPTRDSARPALQIERPEWRFSGRRGTPVHLRGGEQAQLPSEVRRLVLELARERSGTASTAPDAQHDTPAATPVAGAPVPVERRSGSTGPDSPVGSTPAAALPGIGPSRTSKRSGSKKRRAKSRRLPATGASKQETAAPQPVDEPVPPAPTAPTASSDVVPDAEADMAPAAPAAVAAPAASIEDVDLGPMHPVPEPLLGVETAAQSAVELGHMPILLVPELDIPAAQAPPALETDPAPLDEEEAAVDLVSEAPEDLPADQADELQLDDADEDDGPPADDDPSEDSPSGDEAHTADTADAVEPEPLRLTRSQWRELTAPPERRPTMKPIEWAPIGSRPTPRPLGPIESKRALPASIEALQAPLLPDGLRTRAEHAGASAGSPIGSASSTAAARQRITRRRADLDVAIAQLNDTFRSSSGTH